MILLLSIIFLGLLLLGAPIGLAMGVAGTSYFIFSGQEMFLTQLPNFVFNGLDSFVLMAIPFFLLAGEIMDRANISQRIVHFSNLLVGRFAAGLAQVNIMTSMLFAGITGAALGDVAALGKIFIPAMEKEGYDKAFAAAVTAASSLIGPIIPPSIVMVIYCATMELSVGGMFAAAIIPGIMIGLSQMVIVYILAKRRNYPKHETTFTPKEFAVSFKNASLAIFMPVIILGGILSGLATPTEAAAYAVVYALVISFFIYRSLNVSDLPDMILSAARGSAKLFLILAFIGIMSWVFGFENLPADLRDTVLASVGNPIIILIILNLFPLFVGMWMTEGPAILLFSPIMGPLAVSVGLHPFSWGVIMVLVLVMGLITPPVCLVLFATADIAQIPMQKVLKAILPLFLANAVVVVLLNIFPALTLWLPGVFGFL